MKYHYHTLQLGDTLRAAVVMGATMSRRSAMVAVPPTLTMRRSHGILHLCLTPGGNAY